MLRGVVLLRVIIHRKVDAGFFCADAEKRVAAIRDLARLPVQKLGIFLQLSLIEAEDWRNCPCRSWGFSCKLSMTEAGDFLEQLPVQKLEIFLLGIFAIESEGEGEKRERRLRERESM